MSNEINSKDEIFSHFTSDIDDRNGNMQNENEQVCLAKDYANFFSEYNVSTVEGFLDKIYEVIDEYVDLDHALEIVGELNKYIVADGTIKKEFLRRYGSRSNKYKSIEEIDRYIKSTEPRITNIWGLSKISQEFFKKVLVIASQENKKVIQTPAMAYMALLRFYVTNLINEISEVENSTQRIGIEYIKLIFNISVSVKEIELCWALHDNSVLSKLHTAGARSNKTNRDQDKSSYIEQMARNVWGIGCELLHTQLYNLFMRLQLIDDADRIGAANTLKRVAPENRLYGPGVKKIIDACPCQKESKCPLVKNFHMKKRFSLSVAKEKS